MVWRGGPWRVGGMPWKMPWKVCGGATACREKGNNVHHLQSLDRWRGKIYQNCLGVLLTSLLRALVVAADAPSKPKQLAFVTRRFRLPSDVASPPRDRYRIVYCCACCIPGIHTPFPSLPRQGMLRSMSYQANSEWGSSLWRV